MQKLQGFAWTQGPDVINAGTPAPGCTVTVFDAGTTNKSTIYDDNVLTEKSNPFDADVNAIYFFYAANGRYDVQFSGTGIDTPYVLGDFLLADP